MKRTLLAAALLLTFIAGAAFVPAGEKEEQVPGEKVIEIFERSCATSSCHGGKNPKMGLGLEAEDIPGNMTGVPSKQNPEFMLIDTKDPSRSYLLLKITGGEGMKGKKMPIFKKALSAEEIETVSAWAADAAAAAVEKEKEKSAAEKSVEKEESGKKADKDD